MFGFQVSNNLSKYLGVPLLHKKVNKNTYHYILDKSNQKLSGWNAHLLFFIGYLTLAKFVLMTTFAYAIQAMAFPKSLCDHIEAVVRKFIWGQGSDNRKINLVNWTNICMPYDAGGSRLRSVHR